MLKNSHVIDHSRSDQPPTPQNPPPGVRSNAEPAAARIFDIDRLRQTTRRFQRRAASIGGRMARSLRHGVIFIGLAAVLTACAAAPRIEYSAVEAKYAVIPGFPNARMWSDAPPATFGSSSMWPRPQPGAPFTYLALSGGGGEGAYGAGVLNGWTEAGTRPAFTLVSGVSTGALIAPFAFLGPQYDSTLKELYTSGIASTFIEEPNPARAIFGASIFSRQPLREAVRKFATQEVLDAIAKEYAKGRRLIVLTTDLDSERTALWDMGAIAATQSPRALGLFQDVLIASASIPAVFPPMMVDAEADGHAFREMHVDGTVTTPVFTFPEGFLLKPHAERPSVKGPRPMLFIVLNNRIEPTFQVVPDSTAEIAASSFATKNKQDTRAVLAATYQLAQHNGLDFNLTYIDGSIPQTSRTGFDTAYMRSLYEIGYEKARRGGFWVHQPPAPEDSFLANR
jgi:predicted acylesterase/phospholipase RssA